MHTFFFLVAVWHYYSSFISIVARSLLMTSTSEQVLDEACRPFLHPREPAFDTIVSSWSIEVVIVPLLETIDPGVVKVFDIFQLWGFLLHSLPYHSNKPWRDKTGFRCLLHKSFQDSFHIQNTRLLGSCCSSILCVQMLKVQPKSIEHNYTSKTVVLVSIISYCWL